MLPVRDVNGDGHRDMVRAVCKFRIRELSAGILRLSLTGQISNGLSIIGSSPIKTVQCKKPKVSRN